jgi:MFS family permease
LVIGGVVAGRYGWRAAFFVAGVPGVALALLTALTLKEPHRHSISPADNNTRAALREIFSKPTFILMMIGGALVSFINYGQGAFFPSFFLRNHAGDLARMAGLLNHLLGTHLTPLAALGTVYGLCTGISGIASVLLGGYLTDRFARRDMRAYITIQVITGSLRIPCLFVAMFAGDALLALAAITTRSFMQGLGGAAAYAAIPGLVRPAYRSTAIAIWSLALNAIGLGLGPLCVGVLSDSFAPSYGAAVGLKWALLCSEVVLAVAMAVVWAARRSFVHDTVS